MKVSLLPEKHVRFSKSILGFGSYLISLLEEAKTFDELWAKYKDDLKIRSDLVPNSLDFFSQSLTFLYAVSAIELEGDKIKRL